MLRRYHHPYADGVTRLRMAVAVVIVAVWAVGYVLSYVQPHVYHAPSEVTPALLLVVAAVLGTEAVSTWKRTNGH